MMPSIRLFNVCDSVLEEFELNSTPPYLAVSHAWSDHIFPPDTPILSSLGGQIIQKAIDTCFPKIHHCWVDNFCIKQDDEDDKLRQIPLMGSIYHNADAVIVVLSCELGFSQDDVDAASRSLVDALQMWRDETWAEIDQAMYFQRGPGRRRLLHAMRALARFTCSTWATRIWTLQEYILAREVIWVGSDMRPVRVDDRLFQAIPGLCNQLAITECMLHDPGTEFAILHTHFSGMVTSRLGDIDRTRIMELLGNRTATVPVDEVYGIMAASSVEIYPIKGETKEQAWERWCEAAVLNGHIRWLMLPPTPSAATVSSTSPPNCVIPCFAMRHSLSSCSYLDTVKPLSSPAVTNGTYTLTGRYIGPCELIRRLGSTHRSKSGLYHRDITLILFSKGQWSVALQLARAFGGGRYSEKQLIVNAQVMANNYARASLSVQKGNEEDFRPVICSAFQAWVWGDFMQLQARCMMDLLNDGTGFLARISRPEFGVSIITVVVTGGHTPEGTLETLDFNAVTGDRRHIFMVVEVPRGKLDCSPTSTPNVSKRALHKLGTTLPISDYDGIWESLPQQQFSIGGSQCEVCKNLKTNPRGVNQQRAAARNATPRGNMKNLNYFWRRENLVNKIISDGLKHGSIHQRLILRRRKRFLTRRILERK
jgi:hypothetical protein